MKKRMLLAVLAVFVLVSVVAGSLAVYQSTIDNAADGSAVAANFVLDAEGTGDVFTKTDMQIEPGDSYDALFVVKNYDANDNVTETDMKVELNVTMDSGIAPLTLTLKDSDGTVLGTINQSGTIDYDSGTAVFTANVKADETYTVTLAWPETDNDTDYINQTASYSVSVTGTQVVNN